jgi:hypothetical protein
LRINVSYNKIHSRAVYVLLPFTFLLDKAWLLELILVTFPEFGYFYYYSWADEEAKFDHFFYIFYWPTKLLFRWHRNIFVTSLTNCKFAVTKSGCCAVLTYQELLEIISYWFALFLELVHTCFKSKCSSTVLIMPSHSLTSSHLTRFTLTVKMLYFISAPCFILMLVTISVCMPFFKRFSWWFPE